MANKDYLIIKGPGQVSKKALNFIEELSSIGELFEPIDQPDSINNWYDENPIAFQKDLTKVLNTYFKNSLLRRAFSAKLIFWYVPKDARRASNLLCQLLLKTIPGLKVVIFTDEEPEHTAKKFHRAGNCSLGLFRFELEDFQSVIKWSESLDEQDLPYHCLLKDSDGVIRFKERILTPKADDYKVLLLMPPAWNNDYAPYGLAHISGALKEKGHHVKCLDYNSRFWSKLETKYGHCADWEHMQVWMERKLYDEKARADVEEVLDNVFQDIINFQPDAIGISVFQPSMMPTVDFLKKLKVRHPEVKVFIGGPSVIKEFVNPLIEDDLIDVAVVGEGEETATELIQRWKDNESVNMLPGAILNDNKVPKLGPTRALSDIDALPKPDFSDFHVYNYKEFILPIFLSRGCVAKCSFCYETQYWRKFRMKTPKLVFDELKLSHDTYGIKQFRVNDSLMNGSHRLLGEFADLLLESNMNIIYSGYCRLDPKLTTELLNKMAASGCREISFGFESASQKVLDNMKKGVDVKHYERIIKDTHNAGMSVMVNVMVGFPGEGWKEFFQSLVMVMRLRKYINQMNLSIFQIGEGTEAWDNADHYDIDLYDPKTGYWKSKDGKNTINVRIFRYKLFKNLWNFMKNKGVSIMNWDYKFGSN